MSAPSLPLAALSSRVVKSAEDLGYLLGGDRIAPPPKLFSRRVNSICSVARSDVAALILRFPPLAVILRALSRQFLQIVDLVGQGLDLRLQRGNIGLQLLIAMSIDFAGAADDLAERSESR